MISTINIAESFGRFQQRWTPKIVAELNDSYVKLAKLEGEFVWHKHDDEDELFLVLRGSLLIRLRDGDLHVEKGELVVIPRGVEHLPVADEEVQVLLIEPKTTLNTGNVRSERTIEKLEWI